MNRSSRLKNIINRRQDLWDESETDTSSISDNDNMKISIRKKSVSDSNTSSDENSEPSPTTTCCLVCSVLPNLTNVNTCQKHLASLTTPTQVVYMVHPAMNNCPKLHCHCLTKSKHRCRSSSSSSSSSKTRHYRKKRTMTVLSSDTSSQDDLFFSPNVPSGEITTTTTNNQQHHSNYAQARLSPSLPPSSTISTNGNTNLQKYNQLLFTPFLQRTQQENNDEVESMLKNTQNRSLSEENVPDIIELHSDSSCSSSISDNRIVHVKDEGEEFSDIDRKNVSINMGQVTEEMRNHEYPQPVILLNRICLEKYKPLFE